MRTVLRNVPAPEGLGDDVIGVGAGNEVALDLRLESVVEGVLLSGTATVTAAGECVRCLDPIQRILQLALQQLYAYPGVSAGEDLGDDIERLEDERVDLEPILRDAVVLALPLQPVCRDDCPGLCPTCGQRLADDPDHRHERLDPRWAALRALSGPVEQDLMTHVDERGT
jgi:uncharacterized protein